ncbi:hypothetical protein D3C77_474670 [compost metagenome]
MSAQHQYAFTHPDQAKRGRAAFIQRKADTIVNHSQTQGTTVQAQADLHSMRLGMTHDIGQRLLQDAEQANSLGVAQRRQVFRHLDQTRDLRARLESPRLPLDRRGNARIQNGRT